MMGVVIFGPGTDYTAAWTDGTMSGVSDGTFEIDPGAQLGDGVLRLQAEVGGPAPIDLELRAGPDLDTLFGISLQSEPAIAIILSR